MYWDIHQGGYSQSSTNEERITEAAINLLADRLHINLLIPLCAHDAPGSELTDRSHYDEDDTVQTL